MCCSTSRATTRRIRSKSSRCGRAACRSTAGCSACSARWRCSRARAGAPFLQVTDLIAPCVPAGPGRGRIGNFINGELWGRAADPSLPWAMVFPQSGSNMPRHPSQLYQFALEGVLLFVLLWLYARKPRPLGAGVGRVPRRLWRAALHRRVLPRARRVPRPARAQHEHGPVAVRADDRRWRRAVVVGRRRVAASASATPCDRSSSTPKPPA